MKSICINEKYYKKYFEEGVASLRSRPRTYTRYEPIWVEDLQSTWQVMGPTRYVFNKNRISVYGNPFLVAQKSHKTMKNVS